MPTTLPCSIPVLSKALGERFRFGAGDGRAGGQGVVLRAHRHRTLDGSSAADDVAFKLYTDAAQVERVEREVAVLATLRHPALARLIEHGTVELDTLAIRYVAFEFIEGDPLDHRLASGGPLPSRAAAIVGRDVAAALDHIWQGRVVHRDVNPKNIMLRVGDREAVLIDLGIARHLSQRTLTTAGSTWGTVGYMAPEHERADQDLTCLSDVYSLGVTLFESLLGRHPTDGDQRKLTTACPSGAALLPTAPAALVHLIDRMLSPRPAFRPQPDEVVAELDSLLAVLPPTNRT